MRTMLVLAGGSKDDTAVFDTALAAARPLGANLQFLHVRIGLGEAAANTPGLDFAWGPELSEAFVRLQEESKAHAAKARRHFERFSSGEGLPLAEMPNGVSPRVVSASYREHDGNALFNILAFARRNDLVVVGRPSRVGTLPYDLLETLLLDAGRPILIAPRAARPRLKTAIVFWKESAASARAVSAALPLLATCERVDIVSIAEGNTRPGDGLGDLAQRLAWDGIAAKVQQQDADSQPTWDRMATMADQVDADLVVMGGYGHSRAREIILGGCTQRFIADANRPVLMMH